MNYNKIVVPRGIVRLPEFIPISHFIPDEISYLILGFPTGAMGVVLIQMPDQQCRSVTNCFEDAAAEIYAKHFKNKIPPDSVTWFEYWPVESRPEGATLDHVKPKVILSADDGSIVFDMLGWENIPSHTTIYKETVTKIEEFNK